MTIIDRIQDRMAELGLNPFSAAKKAGLGQDYVRDLLRGKVKHPSASKLRLLAVALQCSSDYLLGDTDEKGEAPTLWEAEARPAKLPVSKVVRSGFYPRGRSPEPKGDRSYWVIAAGYDVDEWLELVEDSQVRGEIPEETLAHVVKPDLFFSGLTSVVVAEETRGDPPFALTERSIRKVEFTRTAAFLSGWTFSFDWDEICSPQGASRTMRVSSFSLAEGEEPPAPTTVTYRVVGLVLRLYRFFDNGDGVESPF